MNKNFKLKVSRLHNFINLYRILFRNFLFNRSKSFYKYNKPIFGNIFDYITFEILIDDIYEKAELELLEKWLVEYGKFSKKDYLVNIIDVGANIGNHSRFFSKIAKSVIAIEAHPLTYKLLELNSSDYDNIKTINMGVSNKMETLFMDKLGSNIGGISLQTKKTKYEVRCDTIDKIINNLGVISLLKIDVEGYEFKVIEGAEKLIKKDNPIICFEQQSDEVMDGTTKSIQLLKKYGYNNFLYFEKEISFTNSNMFINIFKYVKCLIFGNNYQLIYFEKLPKRYHSLIIAHK